SRSRRPTARLPSFGAGPVIGESPHSIHQLLIFRWRRKPSWLAEEEWCLGRRGVNAHDHVPEPFVGDFQIGFRLPYFNLMRKSNQGIGDGQFVTWFDIAK